MGKKHLSNQRRPKLPEDLRVLLWILRFGIHDNHSLSTAELFCLLIASKHQVILWTVFILPIG